MTKQTHTHARPWAAEVRSGDHDAFVVLATRPGPVMPGEAVGPMAYLYIHSSLGGYELSHDGPAAELQGIVKSLTRPTELLAYFARFNDGLTEVDAVETRRAYCAIARDLNQAEVISTTEVAELFDAISKIEADGGDEDSIVRRCAAIPRIGGVIPGVESMLKSHMTPVFGQFMLDLWPGIREAVAEMEVA